jgi:Predicted hydrolase of the alpha/beta-hydrolase fold
MMARVATPEERFTIEEGRVRVSGAYARPADPSAALVLAHGAGAGMDHPFMVGFARAMNDEGFATLRFNFPYIENGRRAPDPAHAERSRADDSRDCAEWGPCAGSGRRSPAAIAAG